MLNAVYKTSSLVAIFCIVWTKTYVRVIYESSFLVRYLLLVHLLQCGSGFFTEPTVIFHNVMPPYLSYQGSDRTGGEGVVAPLTNKLTTNKTR